MRAIIIEEDRFTDLTDALRLRETDKRREMHFEFVRWAQSHGASCVRKS